MIKDKFNLDAWIDKDIDQARSLSSIYKELPPDYLQLALMENPFPWPDTVQEKWLKLMKEIAINRYPLSQQQHLKDELCQLYKVPSQCNILLGNGSNEIIRILLYAFSGASRSILAPNPSYFLYKFMGERLKYEVIFSEILDNFELDLSNMLALIKKNNPVLTFITYPNNPTANCFSASDIEEIIKNTNGLVVIDEAYFPYSRRTFLDRIMHYDNVLILRSLSKVGLASIRLGYLIGPEKIIEYVDKLNVPFAINSLSLMTARFMLTHYDILLDQVETILSQRDWLKLQMERSGVVVYPSDSNYLVFKIKNCHSKVIADHFRKYKIIISDLNNVHPLLNDCCRVAIGTEEDNQKFLKTLLKFKHDKAKQLACN